MKISLMKHFNWKSSRDFFRYSILNYCNNYEQISWLYCCSKKKKKNFQNNFNIFEFFIAFSVNFLKNSYNYSSMITTYRYHSSIFSRIIRGTPLSRLQSITLEISRKIPKGNYWNWIMYFWNYFRNLCRVFQHVL